MTVQITVIFVSGFLIVLWLSTLVQIRFLKNLYFGQQSAHGGMVTPQPYEITLILRPFALMKCPYPPV
ncbi:MAG TPA: hypothetical protein VK568_13805, partial [Thermodesulfobacteriota bacterium]|nr:hypothetical protein [Thermodesulfobacteriota bacterium]